MSVKLKNMLRFLCFGAITAIVLCVLNFCVFSNAKKTNIYENFYAQEENSLDLVCVGNSTVRYGIIPNELWHDFGVTSYNICSSPSHLEVICLSIDEIARTQKPKVVYIDLNGLAFQTQQEQSFYVKKYINSMPKGKNRDNLAKKYDYMGKKSVDQDLFDNHNFFRDPEFWTMNDKEYLNGFTPQYSIEEQNVYDLDMTKTLPLSEDGEYYLDRILKLCKNYPEINFVFGKMPRFLNDEIVEETYILRSAIPKIEENGYEYVEWEDYVNEMNLNPKVDARDAVHLNINGAHKFTSFFGTYLKNHYGVYKINHANKVANKFNKDYELFEKNILPKIVI